MSTMDRWSVRLLVGESDSETTAQAWLVSGTESQLYGHGRARRNPADENVTRIGEEIAIARALADLAHHVLGKAASGIESMTHEPARLHM